MDSVDRAMDEVARADFLPPDQREYAGIDAPLPIGHGQTNSQPFTVATMLRLLDAGPGHRVLDVGSGSGWTTALLARLTAPDGTVVGVERESALIGQSQSALRPYADGRAEIRQATGSVLGAPQDAPFDRILVSAEARRLPESLVEQLADGGVMVIPVGAEMHRIVRHGDRVEDTEHGLFRFVPLIEDDRA